MDDGRAESLNTPRHTSCARGDVESALGVSTRPTMASAGGLKLDARLLVLVSALFVTSLLLLVRSINPYFFASLGIASAIGFSVLGAAWYV